MATPTHPNIVDGWFSETEALWPGQKMSLQVKEVIAVEHTGLQDALIFDSLSHGRVLALDGVIQVTASDEFAYQEMITHLPIMAHPDPKTVLIVGGGDGGVAREVLRHASVERVVMCDIDERVVELCKEHLKDVTATAFDEPRLEVLHMDAAKYVKDAPDGMFDVIIVDSTDPVGPAESLYTKEFYDNMHAGLSKDGIICTQGECMWLHLDLIHRVMTDARLLYPVVDYAYTCIPTYPSGQIGFIIACKSGSVDLRTPKRDLPAPMADALRYYSPEMHASAFMLPPFARRRLQDITPVAGDTA